MRAKALESVSDVIWVVFSSAFGHFRFNRCAQCRVRAEMRRKGDARLTGQVPRLPPRTPLELRQKCPIPPLSPASDARLAGHPAGLRRTFAIISHPDAGKTTLDREAAAVRRRHPCRGRGQGAWRGPARALGLDEDRAAARHLGHHLGDAFRVRRRGVQSSRHAGPRGFQRGHLPHADRRRFGGDGDRRRQGHRGAHPQAVRDLPPARRADHHLHQQDGPREPRPDRASGRDRLDPGARRHADELARRLRPELQGHLRSRATIACWCSTSPIARASAR